jgi:hypothetical protein
LVTGHITWLWTIVFGVLAVVGYSRLFRTRRLLAPRPVGAAVARWTGGVKIAFLRASWGTAQLELFDWGIRVSGFWPWKLMLPTVEVRYQELRNVQRVRWQLTEGVLLRTDGSAVPFAFLTTRAPQILVQFAMRGVAVEQEVARLKRADLRT